jgi:hypothetical protein
MNENHLAWPLVDGALLVVLFYQIDTICMILQLTLNLNQADGGGPCLVLSIAVVRELAKHGHT